MTKKKSTSKKSRSAGGLRHVDLARVADRAMHDRDFFEALKDDPEAALQGVGWTIGPEDMETLTQALEGRLVSVAFNAVDFIEEHLDHPECLETWARPTWKTDPPPFR